jgi:hypothetical protein
MGATQHSDFGTVRTRRHRSRTRSLLASTAVCAFLVGPLALLGGSSVAAASSPGPATCGSASLPAGIYTSVDVTGACMVNAGPVTVLGNVTVEAGAALIAGYATGNSSITVVGNITVGSNATLVLGCEASNFPCFDDPNPMAPTLNSADAVEGSVTTSGALGVIVHKSTVTGDIVQTGGGGGLSCTPSGIFTTFGSPVYSDYEDNTIGGNLRVTGLGSCWFGAIRNTIGGSATFSQNSFADPDANENLTNLIAGNLICSNNSPATQYGDSHGSANVVSGFATGECAFSVLQPNPAPGGTLTPIAIPNGNLQGYWMGAMDGGIFSFGVPFFGSQAGQLLPGPNPVVGLASAPGGAGYALADANGMVYPHGANTGDCTGVSGPLARQIVGIAAAPGGNGCWLAAADGGVFALGSNAPFFGSAAALHLNGSLEGIAATPGNDGYDLVASDGGVFTYGPGAHFYGSMGGKPLNRLIVGIATDPVTGGYWLVAADGGIFSFNAPFYGSLGGKVLNEPIVGMVAAPGGDGYYLVAADGGIFAFGTGAHFQGSTGNIHLNQPVVGMALG